MFVFYNLKQQLIGQNQLNEPLLVLWSLKCTVNERLVVTVKFNYFLNYTCVRYFNKYACVRYLIQLTFLNTRKLLGKFTGCLL